MRYSIRINKRVREVRVYVTLKRLERSDNALTRIFSRIFNPKGGGAR